MVLGQKVGAEQDPFTLRHQPKGKPRRARACCEGQAYTRGPPEARRISLRSARILPARPIFLILTLWPLFGIPRGSRCIVRKCAVYFRNGADCSCQETISNAGQSYSAMRYGFAGGGFQYVLGVLCCPADGAESYEEFLGRGSRSGSRRSDFGDSAAR